MPDVITVYIKNTQKEKQLKNRLFYLLQYFAKLQTLPKSVANSGDFDTYYNCCVILSYIVYAIVIASDELRHCVSPAQHLTSRLQEM